MPIALLPARGVVEVGGEDRRGFLQGLVSNDMDAALPGRCVWAALLTPQGKWLADFFVFSDGTRLLLDCARDHSASLVTTLSRYRLRARVTVRDVSAGFHLHAGWGHAAMPEGLAASDPRLPGAGWRALAGAPLASDADEAAYDRHRLALGLPDARDLEPQKTVLLEAGFDELNGISWSKGCYMGQELTARTKYRGLLKKRLFPVAVDGPLPLPGTPVLHAGADIGEMRSGRDGLGLALLRIGAVSAGAAFSCGDATLMPSVPGWMVLPARETA
jgi:hypothetical protein